MRVLALTVLTPVNTVIIVKLKPTLKVADFTCVSVTIIHQLTMLQFTSDTKMIGSYRTG